MRIAIFLVLPLALFACLQNEAIAPEDPIASGSGPLAMAKRKWNTHKPAHFQYSYNKNCYCISKYFGPFQVTATSDAVVEVQGFKWARSADSQAVMVSVKVEGNLQGYSIESVFSFVSQMQKDTANVVQVKFNDRFGYPESLYINPQNFAADGGMSIMIENFQEN